VRGHLARVPTSPYWPHWPAFCPLVVCPLPPARCSIRVAALLPACCLPARGPTRADLHLLLASRRYGRHPLDIASACTLPLSAQRCRLAVYGAAHAHLLAVLSSHGAGDSCYRTHVLLRLDMPGRTHPFSPRSSASWASAAAPSIQPLGSSCSIRRAHSSLLRHSAHSPRPTTSLVSRAPLGASFFSLRHGFKVGLCFGHG
jgi:hypothetical protein